MVPNLFTFHFTEVNSQHPPERERQPARLNPPVSLLPRIVLPRGVRVLGADGLFHPIGANFNLIGSTDGCIIGVRDAYRVLRPLFFHRVMVKVKSEETETRRIIPLTLREYRYYNYNSDRIMNPDWIAQHIRELRGNNNID